MNDNIYLNKNINKKKTTQLETRTETCIITQTKNKNLEQRHKQNKTVIKNIHKHKIGNMNIK